MPCAAAALAATLIAATTAAAPFDLPELDAGRIAAAGIRQLTGQHITLFTDLSAAAEIDELPRVFDAAVPAWCSYFEVPAASVNQWRLVGCVMRDRSRFEGAGLCATGLPEFAHGYSRGSQLWLYDQPSDYYRRHLLLHEGTHCFMQRWLGGAGPPWYMEGMAELLATHRWHGGQLELGVMPRTKDEVPYWGRVKIVKDELAAGRGLSLLDIMRFDSQAHLRTEPYGWCWAATAFYAQHPLTAVPFRELRKEVRDHSADFSTRFAQKLRGDWPAVAEDWQLFTSQIDYGYDIARAAVVRRPIAPLPAAGDTISVAADRGWQSSGYRLEAGRAYRLSATGRFKIRSGATSWESEAGGITIRYADGQPLGMLLAAVGDLEGEPPAQSPLLSPWPIGLGGLVSPERSGTLFLRINEPASGLADNQGALEVTVARK